MPHPSGVLQAYEPAQIERIMAILDRASGGRQIDREEVAQSLLEIIYAIGLATDGTEQSRLWQEFSSHEPSHKTVRDGFLRLARAEDPFALARRDRRLSSLLSRGVGVRRIAGRWQKPGYSQASIRNADWMSLSAADQAEFRKMLEDSASYYARFVKRGREQKSKLDTALLDLADLYLSWTGQTVARHHVPYAAESRFVQFAVAALEPVGWYFEVSDAALSRRWERIVVHERTGEQVLGEALLEQEPEQKS
jgi:hypothetical protein